MRIFTGTREIRRHPGKTSKVDEGTEAVQCCHRARRRPDGLDRVFSEILESKVGRAN